jgi:uncharacterized protein (DUF2147 family)
MMKMLFAVAAFVLASTAAQAQYTFDYGGRTIRIDPDRGTVSIPGVYDNSGRRTKRSRNDADSDRSRKPQAPEQAKIDPQAPVPAPAKGAPEDPPAAAQPPAVAPPPQQAVQDPPAPATRPAPPPVVATAPVSAPVQNPAPAVAAAAPSPNSPLGIWLTEEKEGKVRIEQCGVNLCGYSVDAKSNQNGDQVLINMKPGKDSKWSGRIFDPNTGSTYESTIALKGTDSLRVQGCAFSGMFCGGQTWSRLN